MQLSCDNKSDKDLLNQRLDELVDIIETHQEQNIKEYLAEDFSAARKYNKNNFFQFVRYHLTRNKNVSISVINKEVILHAASADPSSVISADISANVLLLGAEGWLPERGQRYYVESRWKKESGEWVISRLRWTVQ